MFIISLILLLVFLFMLFFINDKIKRDLELVQTENKILKNKIRYLDCELNCYKTSRIYKSNSTNKVLDEDIKEAIKYAMKKSHPDNNGDKEDFDKFRKLYERIK